MEASARYWRARAIIREHVCPANHVLALCRQCPRVPARVLTDVPVSYPRSVVGFQNTEQTCRAPKLVSCAVKFGSGCPRLNAALDDGLVQEVADRGCGVGADEAGERLVFESVSDRSLRPRASRRSSRR